MRWSLLLSAILLVAALGIPSAAADPPEPTCSDGLDNDEDGSTDYPYDPDCASPEGTEFPPGSPECWDGVDNDGDGDTDHPDDAGCDGRSDPDETDCSITEPARCGGPLPCTGILSPVFLQVSREAEGTLLGWLPLLQGVYVDEPIAYLVYRVEPAASSIIHPAVRLAAAGQGPLEQATQPLAAVPGTVTSYFDTTADTAKDYLYWVTPAGSGCQGAASNAAPMGPHVPDLADCFYVQALRPPAFLGPSTGCLPVGPRA